MISKEGFPSIVKIEENVKLLLEGIFAIILFGLNIFLILMTQPQLARTILSSGVNRACAREK